ncbi:HEAT repeat domain-containing protein [Streptomyces coffeae]|uniref:HEAT repeat domain-containing protein n=1 Tax=Streptomyces coffeae TaxID=621382 RepID=A0ABS1N8Q7_9ACTN|nr:HEAT repeat domain-containing protein [Streptomyces coffeae]MBL1096470.1 hypothetical protein [Streptomyces coffeae]
MREGLDAVGWAGLSHGYGSAEDVPDLLRRCAGPDPVDADSAADDLLDLLYHQGGWICPTASAALPFLLRLAARPEVPSRRAVLDLVAMLAYEAGQVAERFLDPGWAPSWARVLPDVLALLADPAAEIRRAAAEILGVCQSPGEVVLPALLRCWETEEEPKSRLDLVLALGRAALREPAGPEAARVHDLLRGLLHGPEPQVRLAAVHALAPGEPGLPARELDLVLAAIRHPSVAEWQGTSMVDNGGARGAQAMTAALLTGPSPAFVLGLLADHPDEAQRIGALEQAGGLLVEWRSPTAALLPALAARLDDPAAEARFLAAELLACLGPSAAAHADAVAGLLEDPGLPAAHRDGTVGDAALWALARMTDPRCVPAVIELLMGARPGFTWVSAYSSARGGVHYPALPALHEVLARLPDHAEPLLPVICDRLGTATEDDLRAELGTVLASWGTAAEPAVPRLVPLLADDRRWTAAATALAGIGAADSAACELLRARVLDGGADAQLAAWAYWKTGGEPDVALSVLGPAAADGGSPLTALRRLADLGPYAARYADRLRTLTTVGDWTGVEAAHALWAATGDTEHTVPALLTAVRPLADGRYLPVILAAVRYLTRMGPAARPAARLLCEVPDDDRRLHYFAGWRAFTEDESLRAAVAALLAAAA